MFQNKEISLSSSRKAVVLHVASKAYTRAKRCYSPEEPHAILDLLADIASPKMVFVHNSVHVQVWPCDLMQEQRGGCIGDSKIPFRGNAPLGDSGLIG